MTRVKVCGITRLEDAELAASSSAPGRSASSSGRARRARSSEAVAAGIARRVRRRAELVGVFVNPTLDEVAHAAESIGLTHVQLHGDEGPSFATEVARRTGAKVIKAARVAGGATSQALERFHTDFHLLDTAVEGMRGGSGRHVGLEPGRPAPLEGPADPLRRAERRQRRRRRSPRCTRTRSTSPPASRPRRASRTRTSSRPSSSVAAPARADGGARDELPPCRVEHRFGPYGGQYVPGDADAGARPSSRPPGSRRARTPATVAELGDAAARLRRPPDAALPRQAALRGGGPPRLPQARGPDAHRRAQDQQRARPVPAGQAHGQDAHHRRDRRGPARRRDRDRVRAARRSSASSTWAPRTCAARSPTCSGWGCWARRVEPVDAGARTLKEAVSAAIRDWVANVADTHYVIGSGVGPAPFPALVRDLQRVIGDEARAQVLEAIGRLPSRVIACVGGGSNAIGIFVPFAGDAERRARRRRGRGRRDRDRPPRRAAHRRRPRRRPARRLLGDHAGRGRPDPRGALDLGRARLPGHRARARAAARHRPRALRRGHRRARRWRRSSALAELEGIIPALESSHAIAWVLGPGPRRPRRRRPLDLDLPLRPRRQGPRRGAGRDRAARVSAAATDTGLERIAAAFAGASGAARR